MHYRSKLVQAKRFYWLMEVNDGDPNLQECQYNSVDALQHKLRKWYQKMY